MKTKRNGLLATLFIFNDLLWALLVTFMVLTALLLTQIQSMKVSDKLNDDVSAGSISVYVYWADGIDLDIDTHLSSPTGDHVYFGRLSGVIWNLLRDDLGMLSDSARRNFENAYARGLPAGDYVVNIHAYRGADALYPAEVEAEVRIVANPNAGKGAEKIVKQKVTLYRTGEETTIARFSIDGKGNIVSGSLNHLFKSLLKEKPAP